MGVLTSPILIALSRWLERFLYRRATHIVVNSPAYEGYLHGKGVPRDKITLIANGVDPTMFDPTACGQSMRERWGLKDEFVVAYTGALGLANDIPTILRAAQRLHHRPDIHFLLVGDGKEKQNLEALAAKMGLQNVIFAGSVIKGQMSQVLAAADACVATLQDIPMFRTTYPNKVFDYMAAGRPTILAIDGVIREVIEAAQGGIFVPPGDDQALAGAVLGLAEDRARARALGKSARAYVVEHFDRHQQAEQFAMLLQRVTRGKEPASANLSVPRHDETHR
jgi:glycosyltransferase involved in cell wall biosynthesis